MFQVFGTCGEECKDLVLGHCKKFFKGSFKGSVEDHDEGMLGVKEKITEIFDDVFFGGQDILDFMDSILPKYGISGRNCSDTVKIGQLMGWSSQHFGPWPGPRSVAVGDSGVV